MKKRPLIWIMKQIRRRVPAILVMTAAQVGHALFSVFFALGTRGVIDSAEAGDPQAFLQACGKQAGIIAGILICLTVLRHLRDRLRADLERDWKKRLLHGLLHGDYAAVSGYHSAELLNRLNNDVNKVNEGVLNILPSFAAMATRLVAAVLVLGVMDAKFTALIALLGGVVVFATALMRRKLKELNKQVSEHDGKVSGFLQETMEKLLMVQTMDVSDEVESRAEVLLSDRYAIQRKRKNVSLLTNTGVSLMSYGAGFLALGWCAWRMLNGQMTFGFLTAVTQLVNQLQTPFVNLSGVLPQYVAMLASAERLMELEAIQGEPAPAGEEPESMYRRMDAICAENLSFSYDRDRVLEKVSFSLPKGAFAVITGPSGIGKSTLLKLLLGVFRPEDGRLCLRGDGCDITLDRSTRRLFAYVPQGNLLLSGTLRENLTIVSPQASAAEIQQAVHISCMDEFLPQLPLGLDTPLGESGAGLSEGQAQRLAIARAVLGGAPVLLLDECTSALDAETEQKVLRRIRALPGRTCIAVTHRPAALALADWQLEVEPGTIRCSKLAHTGGGV
ncbi:MAG: ABC transporter ATP-binding protein [Oscillospiraceae bacterium]|nr:ABC transporter ATP-binding protein [Oscillospiraceae bacterium]